MINHLINSGLSLVVYINVNLVLEDVIDDRDQKLSIHMLIEYNCRSM